jgi:hypothetical protein
MGAPRTLVTSLYASGGRLRWKEKLVLSAEAGQMFMRAVQQNIKYISHPEQYAQSNLSQILSS